VGKVIIVSTSKHMMFVLLILKFITFDLLNLSKPLFFPP